MYFPQHGELKVHQSRICPCPLDFPAGYYWYGTRRKGPGRPPRWVNQLLTNGAPLAPQNSVPGDYQCVHDSPRSPQHDTPDGADNSVSTNGPKPSHNDQETTVDCQVSTADNGDGEQESSILTSADLPAGEGEPAGATADRSVKSQQELGSSQTTEDDGGGPRRNRRLRQQVRPPKRLY